MEMEQFIPSVLVSELMESNDKKLPYENLGHSYALNLCDRCSFYMCFKFVSKIAPSNYGNLIIIAKNIFSNIQEIFMVM